MSSLQELYAWFDQQRSIALRRAELTVAKQGLGLIGSPEDAALLNDVVQLAYAERRWLGGKGTPGYRHFVRVPEGAR